MNIKQYYDSDQPRAEAYCKKSELTAGADGTYTVNNAADAAKLGTGSSIIVIDEPGLILFYDAENAVAYDWTASE